jgi:hypothetical protein
MTYSIPDSTSDRRIKKGINMAARSNVSQTTHSSKPGDQTSTPNHPDTSPTSPEEPKQGGKQTGDRYFGALVLVAAIIPLPFLAALITIIAYLSPSPLPAVAFFTWLGPSNIVIIILGLIITVVLWLLLAIPCMRFATARGARWSDYEGLQRNAEVLKKRLKVVKSEQATATPTGQYKAAIADIESNLKNYDDLLNRNGLPWLSTGYVSLWDRINEADEAIIDVLPCETVIESAKYEELRLKNSLVPDSKNSLNLLEKAIQTLSSANATDTVSSDPKSSRPSTAINGQSSQQSEQEARADIRKVKAALHSFTNERWDGLVRARNQLIGTAFFTAFFTYILVIIAILAKVPSMNTIDAMVFYFLGAIVGLFGRLLDERNTDTVIDDYGLSMARILVTPLISGLAALVGVLFVTASATIDSIYKINLQNLLFAAVLGFAPNILIGMLRSKSEAIKGQLKSASPSTITPQLQTADRQLEQIYEQDLRQASQWFRISILAAILGFLLILGGGVTVLTWNILVGFVIVIAGGLFESIAAFSLQKVRNANSLLDNSSQSIREAMKIEESSLINKEALRP